VVIIGDHPMFVEIAQTLGIRGIRHVDHPSTLSKLAEMGLKLD